MNPLELSLKFRILDLQWILILVSISILVILHGILECYKVLDETYFFVFSTESVSFCSLKIFLDIVLMHG